MVSFLIFIFILTLSLVMFYLFLGIFLKSSFFNAIYYLFLNKVFNMSYCKYCIYLYEDENGECFCMKSGKREDMYYDIVISPNLCKLENKKNNCKKFVLDYTKFKEK